MILVLVLVGVLHAPVLYLPVHQSHVEEWREHEGEAGDKHRADQLEDGAEAGQRLGQSPASSSPVQ